MATLMRVPAEDVRSKTPRPLLVCAYDDEAKCASLPVPGGMPYRDFEARRDALDRGQEIVFYCG